MRAAEMNIPVASYRRQTVEAQDFHRLATVATGKLSPAARLTTDRRSRFRFHVAVGVHVADNQIQVPRTPMGHVPQWATL